MSTAEDLIITEFHANQAVLRFNRPETKNSLSKEMLNRLEAVLDDLESNRNVKTIIFTGAGDAFASGANLKEIEQLDRDGAREFGRRGQSIMQRVFHSTKFTIAAIDGFCLGGALDLAMSCRQRIASPRSTFAHPGVSLGIMTGWSGTQLMPRIIGESSALDLILTAKRINAAEALRIGLIDRISENLLADALEIEEE